MYFPICITFFRNKFKCLIFFVFQKFCKFSKEHEKLNTLTSNLKSSKSPIRGNNKTPRALSFTPYARKHFKKIMRPEHLAKHEIDNEQMLSCHDLRVKSTDISTIEFSQEIRNTTLYAILYIALNIIEDDIQLTDMRRFILEGRLTLQHIRKFFPKNITEECMQICKSINYRRSMQANMLIDSRMLQNIQYVSSQLSILDLKLPNISKLCQRYIKELSLPIDLIKFVDRLIDIYNPEIRWTGHLPPMYEARAMAYIVFILKLLFGLDDSMEHEISESCRNINGKVCEANLFVFDDWVKYLEMRKVILSQSYMPFSVAYKAECDRYRRFEFLKKQFTDDAKYYRKQQLEKLNEVIESFLAKSKEAKPETFDFSLPSLTPNTTYFQTVLSSTKNMFIPDFMHNNPSDSSLEAFIDPKNLKYFVKRNKYRFKVEELGLTEHVHIEKFNNYRGLFQRRKSTNHMATADFNVEHEVWEKQLEEKLNNEALVFGTKEVNKKIRKMTVKINSKEKHSKRKIRVESESLFDDMLDNEDSILDENTEEIVFKVSKMEFWSIMGTLKNFSSTQIETVKQKLPITLKWLVCYCANMLNTKWEKIYDELSTIEAMYLFVLEPIDHTTNKVVFKERCDHLVNGLRLKW